MHQYNYITIRLLPLLALILLLVLAVYMVAVKQSNVI